MIISCLSYSLKSRDGSVLNELIIKKFECMLLDRLNVNRLI